MSEEMPFKIEVRGVEYVRQEALATVVEAMQLVLRDDIVGAKQLIDELRERMFGEVEDG